MGWRTAADGRARYLGRVRDRSPVRRKVVMAIAVLIAGAAAVIAVARDDGPDAEPFVAKQHRSEDVPRLTVSQVPNGLRFAAARDLPPPDRPRPRGSINLLRVYGAVGRADPFARSDLGVYVIYEPDPEQSLDLEDLAEHSGDEVSVGGREGAFFDWIGPHKTVGWLEQRDLLVQVSSHNYTEQELVTVAESLSFRRRGDVIEVAGVPSELGLVAEQTLGEVPPWVQDFVALSPAPYDAQGHTVLYVEDAEPESAHDIGRVVSVAAYGGGNEAIQLFRWWFGKCEQPFPTLGCSVEQVGVRGQKGLMLAEQDSGPDGELIDARHVLIWQEAPGVIVAVQAFYLTEDELLDAAESLEETSDAEWNALLRRAAEQE